MARTALIMIINSHRHLIQFKDEILFDYWHKICYIARIDKGKMHSNLVFRR